MVSTDTSEKTIQSTQTAFDILEAIGRHGHASITEIAEDVDYSRSTVHYHLKTLEQNRYVVNGDDGFRLGLRMARLGNLSLLNHGLRGVVEGPTQDLAAEADATAHVAVEEGNRLVWLYRAVAGADDELPTDVGMETHLHCTAYGQAILAHSSTDAVDEIVQDDGLPAVTDETLTDPADLDARLATVRDLGFAYSAEEHRDRFSAIAAPIVDEESETVVGAIGITDASDRIDDPYKHTKARRFSDELPGLVQQAARIAGDKLTDA